MEVTSRSGIFKTTYANGGYLLLLWKKVTNYLELHVYDSSYFEMSTSIF